MGSITIGSNSYRFEELKGLDPSSVDSFAAPAIAFCQAWLSGEESFCLNTSGSTGTPKTIALTRLQMTASAEATIAALGLRAGDRALVALHTSFVAGTMMLVRSLLAKMHLILVPVSADPFAALPPDCTIDFSALVPLQLQSLLQQNAVHTKAILQNAKGILIGGAPVSLELENQLQSWSCPFWHTYGMTETVSHIALRPMNGKNRSDFFQTVPGIQIETDDRSCLRIRGTVTGNTWLQTNDLVQLHSPTHFKWLGRADYIINTGGIKLMPEKLERTLEKILHESGMTTFAIAGLPHPEWGEAVTLFIEGTTRPLPDLSGLLARYEVPKATIFVPVFPRTATDKIDRKKLRERFENYYTKATQE
jgi:O-succinylbenzoic acid--CoA ligase